MKTSKLAYDRTSWKGGRFNARTVSALKWAEEKAGVPFSIAQGSYNKGVGASGGTHDGGGAVDLRVGEYSPAERRKVVMALKKAGFAAWYRRAVPGLWGAHIHAVLLGDREASPAAKAQMTAYLNGRDGLAGNRPDKTWRPDPQVRWSHQRGKPVAKSRD